MSAHARRPAFRLPVEPEDLVRHALAAYYRAVGDATAPIEDPDPVSWSDPDTFIGDLVEFLQLRLRVEAAAAGHEVMAEPERLATWAARPLTRDVHISVIDPELWAATQAASLPAGAGRSPAIKGHGCPASASPAVGPAPVPCPSATGSAAGSEADITLNADPLFCAPRMQKLPAGETLVDTPNGKGENP